jgi:hypothetical protein
VYYLGLVFFYGLGKFRRGREVKFLTFCLCVEVEAIVGTREDQLRPDDSSSPDYILIPRKRNNYCSNGRVGVLQLILHNRLRMDLEVLNLPFDDFELKETVNLNLLVGFGRTNLTMIR